MKKLLTTTALVGSFAMASTAFADGVEVENQSLLQSLLSQSSEIQSTLGNVSENLAALDGSITINLEGFSDANIEAGGTALIQEGLMASLGELSTTVIGSLGTNTVESFASLSNIQELSQAVTSSATALSSTFAEDNAGLQQIFNLSSNLGTLDGSISIDTAGMGLDADSIGTTVIGSLGTNDIQSNLTNNASALENRLVGMD